MFHRDLDYPTWNYLQPGNIPDIPTWESTIGSFTINFKKGSKTCYVNKKLYDRDIYSGDYTIHITSTSLNWKQLQYTDEALFTKLMLPNLKFMTIKEQNNFILSIRKVQTITIENEVMHFINGLKLNEDLEVVLYTLWHRAIIEDRLYSPPKYSGHKQVLGVAIALIRKMQGEIFKASDKINYNPYLMPKSVYVKNCIHWFDNL